MRDIYLMCILSVVKKFFEQCHRIGRDDGVIYIRAVNFRCGNFFWDMKRRYSKVSEFFGRK